MSKRFVSFFLLCAFIINVYASEKKEISQTELEKLISEAEKTPAEFLKETPLDYPKTLDLNWGKPGRDWNPQKNIGQYLWSIVRPDSSKYKGAVKFLHFLLNKHKKNSRLKKKIYRELAFYYSQLDDWARAAFYYRKAGRKNLQLIECCWHLGARKLAEKKISAYRSDRTRHGNIIKLMGEMGLLEQALKLAEKKAAAGHQDSAYLAAGNVCRFNGDFKRAAEFYRKTVSAKKCTRDERVNKSRAKACLSSVGKLARLSIPDIPDGVYQGEAPGFKGPVKVSVEIKSKRIVKIKILQSQEDQPLTALKVMPERISKANSLVKVDAVTGATATSDAIINAVINALSKK